MAVSAAFLSLLTALQFLSATNGVLSVARGLADGFLDTLPANYILPDSYVARYNLSEAQVSDVERRIASYSQGCIEAPVRVQLDFLYAMMVFTEAVSLSPILPGTPGVRLFTPDASEGVTLSTLFRNSLNYSGRCDVWIADPTTGPCKGGSCGGAAALRTLAHVSTDDLQDLPTGLDDSAAPPTLLPGPEQLPKPQLLMYYRHDIFSARGWSLPATWADLAVWAEAVNGTVDADGDGAVDWALCLDTLPACKSGFLVMAMMASAVQPATPYGTFFEPATMEPLVSTVAFELTLELFRRLARLSPPSGPTSTACRAYEPGFSAGKCLLTISFDQMRAAPAAATTATATSSSGTTAGNSTTSSDGDGDSAVWVLDRGVLPAGALGVAPLPGSEALLDRGTGAMVRCEVPYGTGADRCPNAVNTTCFDKGDISTPRRCRVNRAPLLASLSYDMAEDPAVLPGSDGAQARLLLLGLQVNATALRWARALAGTMALHGNASGGGAAAAAAGSRRRLSRSAEAPADVTPAAVAEEGVGAGVGAGVSTAAGDWQRWRAPSSGAAEERRRRRQQQQQQQQQEQEQQPVSVEDWTNPTPLVQLGYSEVEVSRYVAAYWGSLLGGDPTATAAPGPQHNVVHQLQIRGSSHFTFIYSQAVCWMLQGNVSAAEAARWATADTRALLQLVAANLTRLSYKYSRDIGWSGDDLTGGSGSPAGDGDGGGGGLSAGQLVAAIVVPLAVACLVVAAAAAMVVAVLRRRHWRYKAVEPPGPGLGTTLILTDIQNSTVLWETLPADIMDAAIRHHHEVLRGLLPGHKGYESATEGDAFILAFYTAEDAARYAVVAQEKLLAAPWPAEMLSHPDCEVVWMIPQRADPTACLSYVNRELLSVVTRAVHPAAGGVTTQPGAEASPTGSGREPHPQGPASWLRRLSYTCSGCCGGRRAAGGGGRGSSGDGSGHEGGEGLQERGSGSGGRCGGGDGGPVGPAAAATGKMGESLHGGYADVDGRMKQADSYRGGKTKVNLTLRTPSETAAGGGGGGGGGGCLEHLPSKGPLARLSPLGKCPSDIHSYMTENETDADVSSMLLPSIQISTTPMQDSVPELRLYDSNDVPLPASHAALIRAATGGAAAAAAAPSMLHRTSASTLGVGGGVGGDRSSINGGGTASGAATVVFNMGTNNTAVATLTEVLRQGWRRWSGPAAAAAAPGAGSSSSWPGAASVDTTSESGGGSGGSGGGGGGGAVEPLLAFRGMRVRMGLHTGADLSEVSLNKATGCHQYSGTFMTVAKAVCDAAHGGQVVLSPAAFRRLPPGCLAKSAFLLHMGEHVVSEGCPGEQEGAEALYQLLPYSLSCRLAVYPPLRTREYVCMGLPDAPVGHVTVAFMYVIGAQTLLAWNPVVAGDALSIFQDTVSAQLSGTDGYLVELVDGLCLAAFRSAADALLWSLRCGRLLLTAPWSDELLEHELCEEVSLLLHSEWGGGSAAGDTLGPNRQTTRTFPHQTAGGLQSVLSSGVAEEGPGGGGGGGPNPHPHPPPLPPALQPQQRAFTLCRAMAIRHKTLMRGLRLKVGMDTGFVADSINATTGRMAYRGRPMNRAARIASKALAGQVHCSAAVWRAAAERLSAMARADGGEEVTASSLGLQSFKGVMEKIEVMSVSYKGWALSAEEAAAASRRAYQNSMGGGSGGSSTPAVLSGIVSAFSLGHPCSHSSPAGTAAAAACNPATAPMPGAGGGASCRTSASIAAGSPPTQPSHSPSGNGSGGALPAASSVDRITPIRRSFLPSLPTSLPRGRNAHTALDGALTAAAATAIYRTAGHSTNGYCGAPGFSGAGSGVDASSPPVPKNTRRSDNGGVTAPTATGLGGLPAPTLSSSSSPSSQRGASVIVAPAAVTTAAAGPLASARAPSGAGRPRSPSTPVAGDHDHVILHVNPLHESDGRDDRPIRPRQPSGGNGNGNAAALLETKNSTASTNSANSTDGGANHHTGSGGSGAGGGATGPPPSKTSPELHASVILSTNPTSRPSSASRGSPRSPGSSLGRALGRGGRGCDDEEGHPPSPGFAAPGGGALGGGSGSGDFQRILTLSRCGDGSSCIGLLPLPPPSPSEPLTRVTMGFGAGGDSLRGSKGEPPAAAAVLDFGVRSSSASKLTSKGRAPAGA